jgi:hypothetical protein
MIKITFSNETVLETESFIINQDSVKLIKKVEVINPPQKVTTNVLNQTKAARKGFKKLKSDIKLPTVNFKLSEENRMKICSLWFNSINNNINELGMLFSVSPSSIKNVLKTRGVTYGYINNAKLYKLDRHAWWNTSFATKTLVLNK